MASNQGSFLSSIPPVTKHLLIINVLLWLAAVVLQQSHIADLEDLLGLHFWKGSDFNPAQLLTYMFMHDTRGITHVFFNMFSLWMFGRILERVLGSKRYLFYYISCGLGAGLVQELVWQFTWQDILVSSVTGPAGASAADIIQAIEQGNATFTMDSFYNNLITVGASGAVFGILLAFGMIFPNMPMYIIPFPFPIKAKWMVLGYGAIELLFGISGQMSSVAHFAHIGGMLFGFIMILYWKRTGAIGGGGGYYGG